MLNWLASLCQTLVIIRWERQPSPLLTEKEKYFHFGLVLVIETSLSVLEVVSVCCHAREIRDSEINSFRQKPYNLKYSQTLLILDFILKLNFKRQQITLNLAF